MKTAVGERLEELEARITEMRERQYAAELTEWEALARARCAVEGEIQGVRWCAQKIAAAGRTRAGAEEYRAGQQPTGSPKNLYHRRASWCLMDLVRWIEAGLEEIDR